MAQRARSGHRPLARCRAWLHRLVDDHAYDEWEEDTAPPEDSDVTRAPEDLIDEMLRDDEHTRDEDGPSPT